MSKTFDYYQRNANCFFARTLSVEMAGLYERFLTRVPSCGRIMDAGCGAGRDARAFRERGFRVVAFDACAELAALASEHAGIDVAVRTFADVSEENCYDGIWACASLLHVPMRELDATLARLWRALKPGGTLYVSFQAGSGERESGGRHFTDADEETLRRWLEALPGGSEMTCWSTPDQRPERDTIWTNALLTKKRTAADRLVTGGENPFLPHLCAAMARATEIDIAVAFVMTKGLRLLLPDLEAALGPERRARVRILTSDYLDVTEPEALTQLLLLQQSGAHVRVFQAGKKSFHLKAYVFARFDDGGQLHGTAFVGSSNMSRPALQEGLEWNYRIDYPGDAGFLEARCRFEELFSDGQTEAISAEWIQDYVKRRKPAKFVAVPGFEAADPPPTPTEVQRQALQKLAESRAAGYRRGLVVLATGLGKTMLAAFDANAAQAKRVLFVAHREEILKQAADTFLRVRPEANVGLYSGASREKDAEVVCASVQTLGRQMHLDKFAPDHFDYIVVDEFHHAAAGTYRRVLGHFTPRFLLGLTATPQRGDQADILALCDGNLVFEFGLVKGVDARLLAPFTYFGIYDEAVDYREIPWRNGQFDPEELSARLATKARAEHALREWKEKRQARTLAFCVSIRHADFMAEFFCEAGVRAVAVHGRSEVSRGEALTGLEGGTLDVVFSVDLFNEGVDVPAIDTVLMLRPTDSKILFLQQLGRGLRLAEGKERLVVLDFIGNHRAFLHKPQALFGLGVSPREIAAFVRRLERKEAELPEGCSVNFDLRVIEFLKALDSGGGEREYAELKEQLGRRPSILKFEAYRGDLDAVRRRFGSWTEMLEEMGDLPAGLGLEAQQFLQELETSAMTKSFKMVLLEAFQELDGWRTAPTLEELGRRSWEVLQRRPELRGDVPEEHRTEYEEKSWLRYWRGNPVRAWLGENSKGVRRFFALENGRFRATVPATGEAFEDLVGEMVDFRLARYQGRPGGGLAEMPRVALPFYKDLAVACGHFRDGRAGDWLEAGAEQVMVPKGIGKLEAGRHFVARASGNSMDGGKNPVRDGDYLLLERLTPESAGSITGATLVVERLNEAGDPEYLLRVVEKAGPGRYRLRAQNPAYAPMDVDGETMRTRARLRRVLGADEVERGS